jgi:hypothetical protein
MRHAMHKQMSTTCTHGMVVWISRSWARELRHGLVDLGLQEATGANNRWPEAGGLTLAFPKLSLLNKAQSAQATLLTLDSIFFLTLQNLKPASPSPYSSLVEQQPKATEGIRILWKALKHWAFLPSRTRCFWCLIYSGWPYHLHCSSQNSHREGSSVTLHIKGPCQDYWRGALVLEGF